MNPVMGRSERKWIDGPATVSLGDFAQFQIPDGYRFSDAKDSHATNNFGMWLGTVAPANADSKSHVEFFYKDTGYIRTYSDQSLDAEALLQDFQSQIEAANQVTARANQQNPQKRQPLFKAVKWSSVPKYDASNNSLAWAVNSETESDTNIIQTMGLLGRNGVITATTVLPGTASQLLPMRELLSGVTFKAGLRYADHAGQDKISSIDLTQLITGSNFPVVAKKDWLAKLSRAQLCWLCAGVGFVTLLVVGFLVTREILSLKKHQSFDVNAGKNNFGRRLRSAFRSKGDAGGKMKRTFDYQKFYTDMVLQASGRSYGAKPQPAESNPEIHIVTSGAHQESGQLTSEIIAHQKEFIEEQRRLMQQQAKLIEERSKLIEEKNQLLAKQSEMIENHLL